MTWTGLSTVEARLPCVPPFSFFFDLVATHWKTESSHPAPLHRICTLSRKQGATHVVVESALGRMDVREDIDALDASFGGGGAAEAVAISFFRQDPGDINSVPSDGLLGQLVLINYRSPKDVTFSHSYIFEAIHVAPKLPDGRDLLNNFVCSDNEFTCHVRGRDFTVRGIYYCQQNGRTHVCAHACLRMALNSISTAGVPISNVEINRLLNVTPPSPGLSLGQVGTVIDAVGGVKASIVDCSNLDAAKYLTVLATVVESGHVALLVFTTATSNIEHVVTVFGHTLNSDEWHPEALAVYSGPSTTPYYPGSFWIDHFLVHDDNFGPYYTFSSRALELHSSVKARWIIALHPVLPVVRPDYAEGAAAIVLSNLLPSLAPLRTGRWFEHITQHQFRYILRTILISRDKYIEHLRSSRAHDGSWMQASELALFNSLPDWFYMVEFSLPPLYTGNRSKLGEVLIEGFVPPDPKNLATSILGIRLPEILIIAQNTSGQLLVHDHSMHAHSPIYRHRPHEQVW